MGNLLIMSWFKQDFQENGPLWYMVFMAVKLGILFCHAKHDFQESGLDAQPYFLWNFFFGPQRPTDFTRL